MLPKSNQNGSQNGVSGHSKSQKSRNKNTQKNSYLTRPQKVYFGTPGGGLSNDLFSLKITTIPEIVHMAPQAFKITVRASKMTARASKMMENLITLLTQIQTLAVKRTGRSEQTEAKETKRSKQTKKWHGGGICAQRTGYIYIYIHIYIYILCVFAYFLSDNQGFHEM